MLSLSETGWDSSSDSLDRRQERSAGASTCAKDSPSVDLQNRRILEGAASTPADGQLAMRSGNTTAWESTPDTIS